VKPGQKARVVLDIYPDVTWAAEVDTISPATGAEFAILPPQDGSLKLDNRCEDAAFEGLLGKLGKQAFDGIGPGAGSGGEMER
jgi:hypothetical protein